MTSIDELFKKPGIPSKRKIQVSHDPSHFYKSAKHSTNGDVKGKSHASVEDVPDEGEEEEEEGDEDVEAGPALPPLEDDDEDDDDDDDDEDGRFFGGGVDQGTKAALDFLDERDAEETFVEEKYDVAWVRKLGVNFEKHLSKNAELRAKYEDDPQKFMASEADLDADIKALSILSEHAELYAEFAELGCVGTLVSLLAHENADIAIDAIEIINELVDEDVEAEQEQWDVLVNAALEADLLNLLVQNFQRLDESQETDRNGIYNSLSILESLASQQSLAERIGKNGPMLQWLLARIQKPESPLTQNKQYAAELLAILVQSSPANQHALTDNTNTDGIDTLLNLLAPYRRRDPVLGSDNEFEFVENVFDALTCLVDGAAGKERFVAAEGVELALIMLRDGKMSRPRALRMLDHAVGGLHGGVVCERLVEAQGLKTLFGMFMKEGSSNSSSSSDDKKKKKGQDVVIMTTAAAATTEHLLGVFASLLRTLPGDSAARIRTLAKFVEKDYEKVSRLVELRRDFASRVGSVETRIQEERKSLSAKEQEDAEDDWLSRRLDAGLYSLQTIDVILAWLVAEDDGARHKIEVLLDKNNSSLRDIKGTLQEQLDGVVDAHEEAQAVKDMLATLIDMLN